MRFVFLFLLTVGIFYTHKSFAGCLYKEETRDVINKRIYDEAAFVGLIKIEQTISLDSNPKIINEAEYNRLSEVLVIRPYKGGNTRTLKIYWTYHPNYRPMPPVLGDVGKIYERSIKKIGDNFVYYVGCQRPLYEEYMVKHRQKSKETPLYIEDYKKPCEVQGGEFTNQSNRSFFDCYYPAKDAEKSCNDNSECKGFCLANVTEEEKVAYEKDCEKNPDKVQEWWPFGCYGHGEGVPTESGTCSQHTNKRGYFLSVENGKTKRINTERPME